MHLPASGYRPAASVAETNCNPPPLVAGCKGRSFALPRDLPDPLAAHAPGNPAGASFLCPATGRPSDRDRILPERRSRRAETDALKIVHCQADLPNPLGFPLALANPARSAALCRRERRSVEGAASVYRSTAAKGPSRLSATSTSQTRTVPRPPSRPSIRAGSTRSRPV